MTRKTTTTKFVLSLSALTLIITGTVLYASPLNPPAGPVASTFKTLFEVEPRIAINATNTPGDADSLFKITQPGSYYLTGNITGVVGKHGIEIVASGVTLDLNGFDLAGFAGMGPFDGVSVTVGGLSNIAVVNGSVRNWGDEGVSLGTTDAINCRVEGVLVAGNMGLGIHTGTGGMVSNCTAYQNTQNGIDAGSGGSVSNCKSSFNTGVGIVSGNGCTVSNCTTFYNASFGIVAGAGCTISNCTAHQNAISGIAASFGCTISNCSAYVNTGAGITTSANCTISNCTVYGNTGPGINAFDGSTITNCSVNNNHGRGISAGNGCQITGCLTRNNQSDGISVNFSCTVSGNTCNGDGTAAGIQGGIRVLGQANRIEGNNVTYADSGLLVESGGNIIVRNTVKGCTLNWSIVAGNAYGAIVATPAGAAVNGNAAAASLGSTDPNANFSY